MSIRLDPMKLQTPDVVIENFEYLEQFKKMSFFQNLKSDEQKTFQVH